MLKALVHTEEVKPHLQITTLENTTDWHTSTPVCSGTTWWICYFSLFRMPAQSEVCRRDVIRDDNCSADLFKLNHALFLFFSFPESTGKEKRKERKKGDLQFWTSFTQTPPCCVSPPNPKFKGVNDHLSTFDWHIFLMSCYSLCEKCASKIPCPTYY